MSAPWEAGARSGCRGGVRDRPSEVSRALLAALEGIARACSDEVTVPLHAGCCGFAGDRGFLFPELTESATRREAAQIERVVGNSTEIAGMKPV